MYTLAILEVVAAKILRIHVNEGYIASNMRAFVHTSIMHSEWYWKLQVLVLKGQIRARAEITKSFVKPY